MSDRGSLDWWLGLDKLRKGAWKVARDAALHALAGAAVAIGPVLLWSAGPWVIGLAGTVGAAREAWQVWRDSDHSPHILDRAADVLGWCIGGTLAWAIASLSR